MTAGAGGTPAPGHGRRHAPPCQAPAETNIRISTESVRGNPIGRAGDQVGGTGPSSGSGSARSVCSGSSGDSANSRATAPGGAACTARTPGVAVSHRGPRGRRGPPARARTDSPGRRARPPRPPPPRPGGRAGGPRPRPRPPRPAPGRSTSARPGHVRLERLEPQRRLHPRQRHPQDGGHGHDPAAGAMPHRSAVRSSTNCTSASADRPGRREVRGHPRRGKRLRPPPAPVPAGPNPADGSGPVGANRPPAYQAVSRATAAQPTSTAIRCRPVTAPVPSSPTPPAPCRPRAGAQSRSSCSARLRSAG